MSSTISGSTGSRIRAGVLAATVLLCIGVSPAGAADITFLCAGALRSTVSELIPEFTAMTGHNVKPVFGPIGAHAARVRKGEPVDLAIVSPQQWDILQKEGKLDASVRPLIAKVGIGVFIKKGATRPDIGSVEAFKSALLTAHSIALGDPDGGSPVGAYVVRLLDRLGIGAGVAPKLRLVRGAVPIEPVIKGDADIGLAQVSEIVSVADIELVGPLPAEIQNYTVFTAAIPVNAKEQVAAKALVDFLTSARARSVLKAKGLEHE